MKDLEESGNRKLGILGAWLNGQFTCSHCGKCTRRCDVLDGPGLDMGAINDAYESIMSLDDDQQIQAVYELMQEKPELYHALRQCCFCGHCTAACARHIAAPESMRAWRELFMRAGWMPPDDSRLVMVDNEWNIFSAYRAIYGIAYPEFTMLDALQAGEADTVLFPGCSLVSYAPELTRTLGQWLTDSGVSWALCDACCGSPLMSAGMFERAHALRARLIEQMVDAGIRRLVTICPGCADEFRADLPASIELVPLPELMCEILAQRKEAGRPSGLSPRALESVTFFDSCHDRNDMRNANALRLLIAQMIPDVHITEMEHSRRGTLCCGAGGAVASYDANITQQRVWRVIDEAKKTGAQTVITMCPTCTYTIAQALLESGDDTIENIHYLEALFDGAIDWEAVFAALNGMWTGEYGPWLNETFFS